MTHPSPQTILVHKQAALRKLNAQKIEAEEKVRRARFSLWLFCGFTASYHGLSQFMELQNAVLMRHAAEENHQVRRHSIAMGAMPHGITPSFGSQ